MNWSACWSSPLLRSWWLPSCRQGLLRDWFKPTAELRLILPATGVAGLEVGADVEMLGTKAGIVRRIVLDPDQQMYA